MTVLAKPGVYLAPVRPSARVAGLARADVPVLIGYAWRGPAMVPVRIGSLRQFEGIFGSRFEGAHLFDAVKGFFETGGLAAYVVRVVGVSAAPAQVSLGDGSGWRAEAQTSLRRIVPLDAVQASQPWQDALQRKFGASIPDVGGWANDISVQISRAVRVRMNADVIDAAAGVIRPDTIAGLQVATVLRLPNPNPAPDAEPAFVGARIIAVDVISGEITLDRAVIAAPFLFEVVAFDVDVRRQGQQIERFKDLHPDPAHPRAIGTLMTPIAQTIRFVPPTNFDPTNPSQWPAEGEFDLARGFDDLNDVKINQWEAAVESQADLSEIALVALPDLCRQPDDSLPEQSSGPVLDPQCHLPDARPLGRIEGVVIDSLTGQPLEGVAVYAAGEGVLTQTDAEGQFSLLGLTPALIEVRASKQGYFDASYLFQAKSYAVSSGDVIELVPRQTLGAFDAAEITALQRKLGEGGIAGPYRIVVLDAPRPEMTPQDLLAWRAALGQDRRLFAVAPWIEVPVDGQETLQRQPPSGHICGAFAAGELAQGVHRAPANLALRHAKRLTTEFDDGALESFHASGLNALRSLPGQGLRLMGSRTLSGAGEWQQVSVRRLFDAIEKSLLQKLSFAVFEVNTVTTRQFVRFAVMQFLEGLRRRGMFAGTSAEQSYSVICDESVNTPSTIANGEMYLQIGIAPTRPYEFIRFAISAEADAIEVTEVAQ